MPIKLNIEMFTASLLKLSSQKHELHDRNGIEIKNKLRPRTSGRPEAGSITDPYSEQ
jgi:hypothetical protein